MAFLLNYFPIEILHLIFLHLWANDIFVSLFNITPHLDSVISSYNNYYVDFRNIHKKTYDRLMVQFKDKIKCLIISSVVSVPRFAHIKNFLTLYNLSDFTRLDKLSLIEIDEEYFNVILADIFGLNKLVSLKLDRLPNCSDSRFNRAIMRLTRLDLPDARFFENLTRDSIPNLRCLSVVRCTFEQLKHIFDIVLQIKFETFALKNGVISTVGDNTWPRFNQYPNRLKRLNLQIDCEPVTLNELRGLLSQLPLLTHLDIKGEGGSDLADGRRWKDFLVATYGNRLIVFDFCFTILTYMDLVADEILSPYFSPFWLNRQRPWFVSYSGRGLIYTIPRYASTWCRSDENLSFQTTTYDEAISYNAIKELNIHNPLTPPAHRFNRVNLLRISADAYDVTIENILAIVSLIRIENLEISVAIPDILLDMMPHLHRLSLVNINSLYAILHKINLDFQFPQIRILEINYNPTDHRYTDVPPEILCQLFPNIRRLCMDGIPIRHSYITRVIDGFHSMTYGKFQIDWDNQRKDNAREDLERGTCRLISNDDETNFCFHFKSSFLHLFIWDTNK